MITEQDVRDALAAQMGAEQPAVIVDASGRPARRAREADRRCPRCGAGSDKRVASAGFGDPHPVCGRCGYEWVGESMSER